MKKLLYLILLLVAVVSCNTTEKEDLSIHGIDLSNMDNEANPKDDFYRYVNGNWLDNTEIPGDEGRWGGFNQLRDVTNEQMLDILDEAVNSGEYDDDKRYR